MKQKHIYLSVIVPVFNEANAILKFYDQLQATLDMLSCKSEVWFVNDGSHDETANIIRQIADRDKRVGLIDLSRNFGHQIALTAAFDFVKGDVVICMDGDGQHPPALIPKMLELYERGNDIVLTQRLSHGKNPLKAWSSRAFYRLINLLSHTQILPGSADFRLMSRQVIESLRQFRECHRFLRGIINWMGYHSSILTFEPPPRIAGSSKFTFRKMTRFASDAIFSFSTRPLRISILFGFLLIVISLIQASYALYLVFQGRKSELLPGWASLFFTILGIGGVQLVILGVIGQYIGMIFEQVKNRPLYLLRGKPLYPAVDCEERDCRRNV